MVVSPVTLAAHHQTPRTKNAQPQRESASPTKHHHMVTPASHTTNPITSSDRVIRHKMKLIVRYTNDPTTKEFHLDQEFKDISKLLLRADEHLSILSLDYGKSFTCINQWPTVPSHIEEFVQLEGSRKFTYMAFNIKSKKKLHQLKFDPTLFGYLSQRKIFLECSHFNSLAETKVGFITMKNPKSTSPKQYAQELKTFITTVLLNTHHEISSQKKPRKHQTRTWNYHHSICNVILT